MKIKLIMVVFLLLGLFVFVPASTQAKSVVSMSAHHQMSLPSTTCYGYGLPHGDPVEDSCDTTYGPPVGEVSYAPPGYGSNCGPSGNQFTVQTKAIGSSYGATIGTLQIWQSLDNPGYGCASWWSRITITAPGCYTYYEEVVENANGAGGDGSAQLTLNTKGSGWGILCQGHSWPSLMVGQWTGKCYYADSIVQDNNNVLGYTYTSTWCT